MFHASPPSPYVAPPMMCISCGEPITSGDTFIYCMDDLDAIHLKCLKEPA